MDNITIGILATWVIGVGVYVAMGKNKNKKTVKKFHNVRSQIQKTKKANESTETKTKVLDKKKF